MQFGSSTTCRLEFQSYNLSTLCMFLLQVRQEISPVVMSVISCLVPILQHAQVTVSLTFLHSQYVFTCACDHVILITIDPGCSTGAQQVTCRKQCNYTWETCLGLPRTCISTHGTFHATMVHSFVHVSTLFLYL